MKESAKSDPRKGLGNCVRLVSSFGFTRKTLRADSALLPIAFYLFKRALGDEYLTASKYLEDRRSVRRWLIRSYLKASGIWGSGLDTLLTALRQAISADGEIGFPVASIESVMIRRGKSLTFTREELQDLIELPYGTERTFSLLSLLFETVDTTKEVHVDHIFPISRFTAAKLAIEGVLAAERQVWYERANALPNLQLLEGPINQEKLAKLPLAWLEHREPDAVQRQRYLLVHELDGIPATLLEFPAFWLARRARLLGRLESLIGAQYEVEIDKPALQSTPSGSMQNPAIIQDFLTADLPCNAQNYEALHELAMQGILPGPPDFSAATHEQYRAWLLALISLANKGDIEGLRNFSVVGPDATVDSSSLRLLNRYKNLCIIALEARTVHICS